MRRSSLRELASLAMVALLAASRLAGAHGNPFPSPAALLRAARHASNREALCRRVTGWTGPLDDCEIQPAADGRAALIVVKTECGSDSCDAKAWVQVGAKLFAVADWGGGGFAMLPSLEAGIMDRLRHVAQGGSGWRIDLVRWRIADGQVARFAECMSPRLSPGGQWILCRNRAGDVLKVPVSGGELALVARSGLSANEIEWQPYAFVYPGQVEFPDATTLKFQVERRDAAGHFTKSIRWSE